jgi:hypothetical protein
MYVVFNNFTKKRFTEKSRDLETDLVRSNASIETDMHLVLKSCRITSSDARLCFQFYEIWH